MSTCPFPRLENGGLPQTEYGLVACPSCGFDCVHIEQVLVDQLGIEVVVGPTGPVLRAHDCDRRGPVVRVLLVCESGHRFAMQLAFYKGSTFVGHEHVGEFDVGGEWPLTLQRD